MIFYFTATGNSLYVAKQLDDDLHSIPQVIREEDAMVFQDESIGIVCPVYGSEPPQMVRDFLTQAAFDTDYFYIVMTYGCSAGASASLIRSICTKAKVRLDYFRTVLMVDNYLPGFDMNAEMQLDKQIDAQLATLKADIAARRHWLEETTAADQQVYDHYLTVTRAHPELSWKNITFTASDACTGCGWCVQVCPSGSAQLADGHALFDRTTCQRCLACVHSCPQHAITMSVPEINPEARYRNPYIDKAEIARANGRAMQ